MSLETECFSMNSDISKRMRALSDPKRKLARVRAISVLPTPVGPRKRKLPMGRCGDLRPARERRMARARAEIAFPGLGQPLQVALGGVATPHGSQHRVTARLQRQVEVVAHLLRLRHWGGGLRADVPR